MTPNLNLHKDQPLLICTRQDIPPRIMFPGASGAAGTIPTSLRLPSLTALLVVDRDGAGPIAGNIDDVPKCFGPDGAASGACALYAACLNLNFNFTMTFLNSPSLQCGNVPGFINHYESIQVLVRQAGSVCDGSGVAADDGALLDRAATNEVVTITLPEEAQKAAPPICLKGFDLGDLVTCNQPTLLTFKGSPATNPAFQDYVGVTCDIQSKGP